LTYTTETVHSGVVRAVSAHRVCIWNGVPPPHGEPQCFHIDHDTPGVPGTRVGDHVTVRADAWGHAKVITR
jgi:hypothetical protein